MDKRCLADKPLCHHVGVASKINCRCRLCRQTKPTCLVLARKDNIGGAFPWIAFIVVQPEKLSAYYLAATTCTINYLDVLP